MLPDVPGIDHVNSVGRSRRLASPPLPTVDTCSAIAFPASLEVHRVAERRSIVTIRRHPDITQVRLRNTEVSRMNSFCANPNEVFANLRKQLSGVGVLIVSDRFFERASELLTTYVVCRMPVTPVRLRLQCSV